MNRISVFAYLTDDEQKTLDFIKYSLGMNLGDEISMSSYKIIKALAKFALWESAPLKQNKQRRFI